MAAKATCSDLERSQQSLLDLPDELLFKIFKHAGSKAIVNLSFCSKRLQQICHDCKLWRVADFSASESSLTLKEAWIAIEFLLPSTVSLSMTARDYSQQIFSRDLLNTIKRKCPSLHTLELIDWQLEMRLNEFPPQLLRLSLIGSKPCELMEMERQIRDEANDGPFPRTSYFYDIVKHIPRLQSLNLTRCRWLNSHSLLALSKITCLRELVLNDCFRIGNNIAYTALASGMGFYALERVDLRNTKVDDGDLKNFLTLPNIKEIFFGLDLGYQDPRTPLTDMELLTWDEARGCIRDCIPCYKLPEEPLPAVHSPLDSPPQETTEKSECTRDAEVSNSPTANSLEEEIKLPADENTDMKEQVTTGKLAEKSECTMDADNVTSPTANSLEEEIKLPADENTDMKEQVTTGKLAEKSECTRDAEVSNSPTANSLEEEIKLPADENTDMKEQVTTGKLAEKSECTMDADNVTSPTANSLEEEIKLPADKNTDMKEQVTTGKLAEKSECTMDVDNVTSPTANSLEEEINVPAVKNLHIQQLLAAQESNVEPMDAAIVCDMLPTNSVNAEQMEDVLLDQDQAIDLDNSSVREKPARKIRRLHSPQPGSSKRVPEVIDLLDSDEELPRKVPSEKSAQKKPVELICLSSDDDDDDDDDDDEEEEEEEEPVETKGFCRKVKLCKALEAIQKKLKKGTMKPKSKFAADFESLERMSLAYVSSEASTESKNRCSTSDADTEPSTSCSSSEADTEPSSSCILPEAGAESSCILLEASAGPSNSYAIPEAGAETTSSCSSPELSTEPTSSCMPPEVGTEPTPCEILEGSTEPCAPCVDTEPTSSCMTPEASDESSNSSSSSEREPNPVVQVLTTNRKRTPQEWRQWQEHRNFEWEDTDPRLDTLEENENNIIVVNLYENRVYRAESIEGNLNEPQTVIPGEKITSSIADYPICERLRILCATGCAGINNDFLKRLGEHGLKHLQLVDVRETSVTAEEVTLFKSYQGGNVQVNL